MTGQTTNYSQIIDAQTYCRLIGQHLYIRESDIAVCAIVRSLTDLPHTQVVELGTGPARLTERLARVRLIDLMGIDIDETFVAVGNALLEQQQEQHPRNATIIRADARSYRHNQDVDIFVSQGFHHHVEKGSDVSRYLENVADQLKPGGHYICSDEFLPHYGSDGERLIRAIVWYSHVIDHAIKHGNNQLAAEEAKTLLDDLAEGRTGCSIKNEDQIRIVLESVEAINQMAWQESRYQAARKASELLVAIKETTTADAKGDPTIDLSRGDFKIDHRHFVAEVEQAGLQVVGVRTFGPISTIGGMAVYTLQKPQ